MSKYFGIDGKKYVLVETSSPKSCSGCAFDLVDGMDSGDCDRQTMLHNVNGFDLSCTSGVNSIWVLKI